MQEVYKPYISSNENPEMLPTFLDFYNLLLDLLKTDPTATGIVATLELYVTGSFNIFSGHTNIKLVVIYAEKASLAKAIAEALHAGRRIASQKEPTIGHYEFTFKGEKAILCHGVGHLCGLADAKMYGEQFGKWDLTVYPCIPFDKADWLINATDPDREGELIFGYIYQSMSYSRKNRAY